MKRMLIAIVALALLAFAAPVAAQDEAAPTQWREVDVEALMEDAPGKEDYPEASAVFLMLQELIEVDEQGMVVAERNKLTRVLTLQGRERYSNPSFYYDTDRETIELVRGMTIRSSGREVEVEEDGINDITPAFLEGATIYANVLEKVISFPVAGPGSTMDLQTRREQEPAPDMSFSGIEYMGDTDPVMKAQLTLRYPASEYDPVFAFSNGMLGDARIETEAGDGEIVFEIEDVPALVPEEQMPPRTELLPRVVFSSYRDWNEPAEFLADVFYPHVQTDGNIAARIAELTSGLSSEEERTEAIFLDVAQNIRNVYLSLGIAGYEPNDATTVLDNKYADTRDKAVLLVSMLRAAGVTAYPATVKQMTGAFEESVPTLKQFNRLLVAVPADGGYKFLDPFLDDARYGYLRWGRGNTTLVVKDDGTGELVDIPAFQPADNQADKWMRTAVAPDGSANVTVGCDLAGYFDRKTRMQLKDATTSERDKVFEGSANAVSAGAKSITYSVSDLSDLTEPVSVTQEVDAPDFAVPQGDMMIVRVPRFPFGFSSVEAYPALAERKYPYEMPCESATSLSVEIGLPDGYKVVRMPEARSIESEASRWELACSWDEATNTITWKVDVTFKEKRVPTDLYAQFKKDFDSMSLPKNRLILLERS